VTDELPACIREVDGTDLGDSMFGSGQALWVDGREIAHRDDDGRFDVRLTRQAIRELRARLRADPRVHLRASTSSDGIELELDLDISDDAALLVELVSRATAEHQPPTGAPRKLPPEGEALARRRRFH
jgi:hypothetical protein